MTGHTTRDLAATGEEAAISQAAEMVREKLDLLLDRVTDTVLGIPAPGTPQWRNRFHNPDELTRVLRSARRVELRALIAERAGVADPAAAPQQRRVHSLPRRRARTDPAQLSIF
ncbi:hypothetical protein [Rhodococcus sp. UFZ-B548]|uniref:hypothetical protein n=1 Tax=Rhodococcus sp. UFZ-B548 TaxID=2742212 RepID=UPI0015F4698A|nr:hypothetical protein [Rhodococcus sp. UFZ-B548]